MRTRAQTTRDAALRRLTRVNQSLALAAVVSVGVITDVVANTASGHARTITTTRETSATGRVELLTSPQSSPTRKSRRSRHRAVTHHSAAATRSVPAAPSASSSAPSSSAATSSGATSSGATSSAATRSAASSSASSSSAPSSAPVTVQPTVVAVSGGS